MHKPLVAGNWKMYCTVPEGLRLLEELEPGLQPHAGAVDLVVLPPAVMLWEFAKALKGKPIALGAQNACWADEGAYTGEISPRMLAGWCSYLLIGHSERRQIFGETDEQVNLKLRASLRHGLRPIVAVGETLAENEQKRTREVVQRQLEKALDGSEPGWAATLSIAYEPVWAIGTGRAATPEYANEVMGMIRSLLRDAFNSGGETIRILYGGSVIGSNAMSLMVQPEIDGALVGGASLRPAEFVAIVQAAAQAARERPA